MISCKVVNEVVTDHSLTKFSPISGILPVNFPKVYGDSFISGKNLFAFHASQCHIADFG